MIYIFIILVLTACASNKFSSFQRHTITTEENSKQATLNFSIYGSLPETYPKKITYISSLIINEERDTLFFYINPNKDSIWAFNPKGICVEKMFFQPFVHSIQKFHPQNGQKKYEEKQIFSPKTGYLLEQQVIVTENFGSSIPHIQTTYYQYHFFNKNSFSQQVYSEKLIFKIKIDTLPEYLNPYSPFSDNNIAQTLPFVENFSWQKIDSFSKIYQKIDKKHWKETYLLDSNYKKEYLIKFSEKGKANFYLTETETSAQDTIIRKYTKFKGNIVILENSNGISPKTNFFWLYKYDKLGNWTQRDFYKDDTTDVSNLIKSEHRIFEY